MRERFGIVYGDSQVTFPSECVDKCFNTTAQRHVIRVPPKVIYVAVDPGFTRSDLAMVAMAHFLEGPRIVGLAAWSGMKDPADQCISVQNFIYALRSRKMLRNVPIVFIPENAPEPQGIILASHVQNFPDLITMNEVAGGDPGVPINNKIKTRLVNVTTGYIYGECMRFTSDMVALTNKQRAIEGRTFKTNEDFLISLLAYELKNYHPEIKEGTVFMDEKLYYTGKGYGMCDDMVMALMMVIFWSVQFNLPRKNEQYDAFRIKHGLDMR
jgi:hypothetical protein